MSVLLSWHEKVSAYQCGVQDRRGIERTRAARVMTLTLKCSLWRWLVREALCGSCLTGERYEGTRASQHPRCRDRLASTDYSLPREKATSHTLAMLEHSMASWPLDR